MATHYKDARPTLTPGLLSDAARESVNELAALNPAHIAPGHGEPDVRPAAAPQELAADFDRIARPTRGRYVDHPQRG